MERDDGSDNGRMERVYYICAFYIFISFACRSIFINIYKYFITFQATVLLNANVAFLAIQSVDSSGAVGHRSNAQRASYFSIVNSIGAIVLGLLLIREHNTTLSVSRAFFFRFIMFG